MISRKKFKRRIKWKWLLLGIVIVAVCLPTAAYLILKQRQKTVLEEQLVLMRAQGRPVHMDEIVKVSPPEDNAGYLVDEAKRLYDSLPHKIEVDRRAPVEAFLSMSPEDREFLKEFIQESSGVLTLLQEAAIKPRFTIYNGSESLASMMSWEIPRLPNRDQIVSQIVFPAMFAYESGNTTYAVESVILGLRLCDKLLDLPMTRSVLISIHNLGPVLNLAEHILPGAAITDETLVELVKLCDASRFRRAWSLDCDMQRIFTADLMWLAYARDEDLTAGWRTWPGMDELQHMVQFTKVHRELPVAHRLFARQADIELLPFYASSDMRMKQAAEVASLPPGAAWVKFVTYASKPRPELLKALARLERVRVILQCKRYHLAHGKYPIALADLVPALAESIPLDSMTGTPLDYKCEAEGTTFTLEAGSSGSKSNSNTDSTAN